MAVPYTVALVVDPAFGDKLYSLAARMHTWAVDTPENRTVAEQFWAALPSLSEYNIKSGVTIFTPRGTEPEEWCISVIDDVDIHHNQYSHDPEYTVLEVHGVNLSQRIQERFGQYGFVHFDPTLRGFVARKE